MRGGAPRRDAPTLPVTSGNYGPEQAGSVCIREQTNAARDNRSRAALVTCSLVFALVVVGTSAFDLDASVSCHRAHGWSPTAEINRQLAADTPLNSYRKVDAQMTIHGTRFQMS